MRLNIGDTVKIRPDRLQHWSPYHNHVFSNSGKYKVIGHNGDCAVMGNADGTPIAGVLGSSSPMLIFEQHLEKVKETEPVKFKDML